MLGVVLAATAALAWGVSAIFVRLGSQRTDITNGTLISLVSGLTLSLLIALAFARDALSTVSLVALLLFAFIGILQYPMGRFFNYKAVSRIGIAGSTPLISTAPLFAVLMAVVFTGERLTLPLGLGAGLIFAGVYLTMTRHE